MIQLQFLNKLLSKKNASLLTTNNLSYEFFSDYINEYKFIQAHLDQYGTIPDIETFIDKFPDFDIINVTESDKYLLDALYEDRNKRVIAKAYNKVRESLQTGNVDKALNDCLKLSENLAQAKHLEAVDIYQDLSRYDEYVSRTSNLTNYYVKTGFPELDGVLGGWDRKEELATIIARPGIGKCLEKGTKILMADGTLKKVEDIIIGDKVQSLNCVNNVLALHNGKSKGYKIIPNNGDSFIVSENHILSLMRLDQIWDSKNKISTTYHNPVLEDIMIEDFISLPASVKRKYSLYSPAINYPTKENLKIPPYILGCWLGDGTKNRVELTSKDDIIINEWVEWAKSLGLKCRKSKDT